LDYMHYSMGVLHEDLAVDSIFDHLEAQQVQLLAFVILFQNLPKRIPSMTCPPEVHNHVRGCVPYREGPGQYFCSA